MKRHIFDVRVRGNDGSVKTVLFTFKYDRRRHNRMLKYDQPYWDQVISIKPTIYKKKQLLHKGSKP